MRKAVKFRRAPVPAPARQRMEVKTFPAPVRGWVANESLVASQPGAASVMENFFPTLTGARLRAGSYKHAVIGATAVESLFSYRSGLFESMFAASAGNIYDVTLFIDPVIPPEPLVTGQTANYYSTAQFATVGGEFLIAVNGADSALFYDGAAFEILDTASAKIAFDAQTGDFAAGQTITGGTSGATAVIVTISDAGTTGTLRVKTVTGTFVDNEIITDALTGSATTNIPTGIVAIPAITGADTADFSHVWAYGSRLFFVEKGTKTAHFLPVDSIGGAVQQFTLDGIFKRGGALLFGGTWSLDAGDGLDDKCVFVSTEGEIAIYEGTDPASSTDWRIVGRYDISKPLGFNAIMQAGGDLLLACVDGVIPLSEAIRKDPAALTLAAVSRPIEPFWKLDVNTRSTRPWEMLKWPEKNMAIVSVPGAYETYEIESRWGFGYWRTFIWGGGDGQRLSQDPYCYVVNLQSGKWAKYTGWDVQCLAMLGGSAFFGTSDGRIMRAESGGSDDGASYVCRIAGLFEGLTGGRSAKQLLQASAVWRYGAAFIDQLTFSTDYVLSWPAAPVSASPSNTGSLWDSAVWDSSTWDSEPESAVKKRWISVGKSGSFVAPVIQVTCGGTQAPDAELASIDLTYEVGGVVV